MIDVVYLLRAEQQINEDKAKIANRAASEAANLAKVAADHIEALRDCLRQMIAEVSRLFSDHDQSETATRLRERIEQAQKLLEGV